MVNNSSQEAIRAKCFHPRGTFVPFERAEIEQSIPERFEKIVAKYPKRIAVKTGSTTLTYEALNKAANQIAWAILEKRGSRPEPIVLLLEHGAPMIAAIIGALKTGKFYVPLDSSLPQARVADILEDSQAEEIVTNNENLALASKAVGHERGLLNIDKIDSSPSDSPGLSISPDALTYILYTSGSTGRPKGVVHNYRNVLHDCMVYTNHSHFCPDDRLTLLHSCSFAAAKHYLFGALLNGAAIYPFDIKREGLAHLAEWLTQEKITAYHSGVLVYRYFLDTLTGKEEFPDLRLIKLGSQQVFKRDWEAYKKHFSTECVLVNALSSTEASTVRWYLMDKRTEIHGDMVPVGYPVEDMETLLLDDEGKITLSQEGEIAIRSPYLALGYWRDPHLSSAAFQDSEDGTARIYRTGDLGLMAADGCLTHLGRKDLQVKVRGYRINVGEIETALVALDSIKEAVVTARDDSLGEKRLVAYVVPAGEPVPAISTIRRAVAMKLPDYMVPSSFVMLNALPLTPNGKVDRGALPAPGRTRPELKTPWVSPSSPVEQSLARIWAEVLGLDQVGIHDNFLDLGGHSLMATQIITRVIGEFRVELPLQSMLEAPTVAEMALIIVQSQAKKAGDEDLARMLAELEALSDDEAQRQLSDNKR